MTWNRASSSRRMSTRRRRDEDILPAARHRPRRAEKCRPAPSGLDSPGALPVRNREAVEWTIKPGSRYGCEIAEHAVFSCKIYFYFDNPKGFSLDLLSTILPSCTDGNVLSADGRRVITCRDQSAAATRWKRLRQDHARRRTDREDPRSRLSSPRRPPNREAHCSSRDRHGAPDIHSGGGKEFLRSSARRSPSWDLGRRR